MPIAASFKVACEGIGRLGRHVAILDAVSRESQTGTAAWTAQLEPLRAEPARAAVLTDVDGTLAPIVERAGKPRCRPRPARRWRALTSATAWSAASPGARPSTRGGWSGSRSSPTPATTAWNCCCPATRRRVPTPRWPGAARRRRVPRRARRGRHSTRPASGSRTRGRSRRCTGAARRTRRRRRGARPRARRRRRAGRPRGALGPQGAGAATGRRGGKDGAVASLLAIDGVDRATYAGDDRTDLDAFRRLARAARGRGARDRRLRRRRLRGGARRSWPRSATSPSRGRRAGWGSSNGWRSKACPTPTCSGSPSSSPAPRRRPSARSPRSPPIATATPRRSSSPPSGGWSRWRSASTWAAPRAADDMRGALAAPAPPPRCRRRPGPDAVGRLWPIAYRDRRRRPRLHLPRRRRVGAGYALIVSLAWHTREAAVLAIEQRDGVKFYVEPNPALKPIELTRTPGLRSDRLTRPRRQIRLSASRTRASCACWRHRRRSARRGGRWRRRRPCCRACRRRGRRC